MSIGYKRVVMIQNILLFALSFQYLEKSYGASESIMVGDTSKLSQASELIQLLEQDNNRGYSEDCLDNITKLIAEMSDHEILEIPSELLSKKMKSLKESLDWGYFMGGDYSPPRAEMLKLLAVAGDACSQYHYARYLLSKEIRNYRSIGEWLIKAARADGEENALFASDALALLFFAGIEEEWVIGADARPDVDLLDLFEHGVQSILQGD